MSNTGNTQQIIEYGATANDGQGDPLRTAFIKTDENFSNIWIAGPVGSNITIANNTVQTNNTNGNLILKPNGVGVIQANAHIVPNMAGIRDLGTANLTWRRAYINELLPENLTVSGDVTIGGNLTVEGDTIQIGNITTDTLLIQLANAATTDAQANGAGITVGANDDIATLLYDSGNNVWTTNIGLTVNGAIAGASLAVSTATIYGNLAAINGAFTGNVTANYFIGDGSQLTGLYANANAAAYGEAGWAGNIMPSANAVYSLGDASHYWSNLWVANNTIYLGGVPLGISAGNVLTVGGNAVLTTGSNTTVSTTGNITANYFFGNGSQLTGLPSTGNIVFTQSQMQSNVSFNGLNLDDGSNVRLFSAGDSPIVLVTNSGGANAGSPSTWTFATNGTFYPADDVRVGATGGRFIQDCADGTTSMRYYNIDVESESELIRAYTGDPDGATPETERGRISVDWLSNTESGITIVAFTDDGISNQEYAWKFQGDGTAEFPGNVRIGASAASQINTVANSSGDGSGYTTLQLIPDETLIGDQYIIIDPTVGGHIHIRAGGTQDDSYGELYLGGEKNYVRVIDGNDGVRIQNQYDNISTFSYADPADFTAATWYTDSGQNRLEYTSSNAELDTRPYQDVASILVSWNSGANSEVVNQSGVISLGGGVFRVIVDQAPPVNPTAITGIEYYITDTYTSFIRLNDNDIYSESQADTTAFAYGSIELVSQSNVGYITLTTDNGGNSYQWNFDANGVLNLPAGEGIIKVVDDSLSLVSLNTTSGNANSVYLGSSGGLGFFDQEIGGNWLQIFRSGAEPEITVPVGSGSANLYINNSSSGNVQIWNFDADGDLSAAGNITANYFFGNGSQLTDVNAVTVDITDTNGLTTVYYPTFVENRTTGQIARADVDLTYKTDDNLLTVGNVSVTGNVTANTAGFAIGYRDIPQVTFSANATAALADAGKHYYSTTAGNLALTLPDNSSVTIPTGATLTIVVNAAGNVLVNQGTGVSLYQAGASATGNRVVGAYGLATVMKVAANTWVISGTGVY